MRVLFVVADLYFSEPLGVMILSGICRNNGHQTRLAVLQQQNISEILDEFQPDLIGYSAMTPDEHLFVDADVEVRDWARDRKKVWRVMGGATSDLFPGCALQDGIGRNLRR